MLGHLVLDFAGMEANFAGIAQPGYYRVDFAKNFAQTPFVLATPRDVIYPGGGGTLQPWTVYLKDVVLDHFHMVVQRAGQPLPGGNPAPAGPDANKPIYVYW